MNDSFKPLTPKDKLALSRAELLAAMGYQQIDGPLGTTEAQALPTPHRVSSDRLGFLARWWRRHPASTALELMEPSLSRFAHRHPAKLMAYSACAGGLLVLLKPWRLLSVGAAVALLFRASDLSGAIHTALRSSGRATTEPSDNISAAG
ncbi:hypothetical protein QTH90_29115 [Variovorax sp. J2P1-59]|uniref:hypothetical protein n=1 Tax=Variovorax flavidus TaxID=3053501 RepID=UPI0025759122|nr:hypothetical protein [Variovorax sp. J2P1-59]MDM0078500.1 hypothetical protein [Variovorax sp. J2P1-59]